MVDYNEDRKSFQKLTIKAICDSQEDEEENKRWIWFSLIELCEFKG